MIFGPNHYVPVLKVKRAEKAALRSIAPSLCERITPLLEIVARKPDKTVADHLKTSFDHLADSVKPYAQCFLDLREIASDGQSAAVSAFQRAARDGIVFTPVTGLSRTADVTAALAHQTNGLAIRVTRSEFERVGLPARLQAFMSRHGLIPEQTDLIIDLGLVDSMLSVGVAALTDAGLQEVPDQTRWRTLTVSACAFPSSLASVGRHAHGLIVRTEWCIWKDHLHVQRKALKRLPTFSDCIIQHSKGVEWFDPRTMKVSAAIRYAYLNDWLIIRGESIKRTPPRTQFPRLAAQLTGGPLQSYYSGPQHCAGCELIQNAAGGASGLGSLEVWRRIGTIHHITSVIDNLSSLPWP